MQRAALTAVRHGLDAGRDARDGVVKVLVGVSRPRVEAVANVAADTLGVAHGGLTLDGRLANRDCALSQELGLMEAMIIRSSTVDGRCSIKLSLL